jgi:hypothetical protein
MKLSYWHNVVDSYGQTRLSFPTDRLIALSGIAREVQAMLQTTYVAGMWQNQLPDSLLWYCGHENRSALTPKYIAPSWSWASVARCIWYPDYAHGAQTAPVRSCATVLDVGVVLATDDDPFGQVTEGQLHIRGKLGLMKWSGGSTEPNNIPVRLTGADLDFANSSPKLLPHSFMERSDLRAYIIMDDFSVNQNFLKEEGQAYYLPIQLPDMDSSISDFLGRVNINGLLLAYLPCGKFKRIGTAEVRDETAAETFNFLTQCDIMII